MYLQFRWNISVYWQNFYWNSKKNYTTLIIFVIGFVLHQCFWMCSYLQNVQVVTNYNIYVMKFHSLEKNEITLGQKFIKNVFHPFHRQLILFHDYSTFKVELPLFLHYRKHLPCRGLYFIKIEGFEMRYRKCCVATLNWQDFAASVLLVFRTKGV